ncbi:MAG: hypothetical protein OIF57_13965 [Marinobacterium sp.]|nr:hypothetical protein [Marinobacterium sp.]
MTLTFKEKRALQRTAADLLEKLRSGNLKYKAKRAAQKELWEILTKLKGGDAVGAKTLMDKLVAGQSNDKSVDAFIDDLQRAWRDDEDLEKAKQAAIGYVDSNKLELEGAA